MAPAPELSSYSLSQPSSSLTVSACSSPERRSQNEVSSGPHLKGDSNPDLSSVLRVTQGVVPSVEATLPGQAPCTPQARPVDPVAKAASTPSSSSLVSGTPDRSCYDRPPEDLKLNIQPLPID
eukprot:gnl/MRDRNA2_/MRDRNA2_289672_c0_seq1.p1 gnl/MRDRNA2_/MRDRNA2_289672_c0~~gnl/MRDRNA2_/MRDRNA2_289672_c0_seq1.p1  ORF type:complete len:144 (-),score=14.59 gnl/MRDRNA2_/MRDRNA2_289672_c0_seq1:139-507(-)